MKTQNLFQWKVKSVVGDIYLEASGNGLRGLYLRKQKSPFLKTLTADEPAAKFLSQAEKEVGEYFSGKRKKFTVKLEILGTPFQKKVWQQLQNIPFGKTNSYKDVAALIKNPKAVRAVGTANGKNPFCIIIPCHRVIAADGTLGGYSGGLAVKKKLLSLEGL